MPRVGPARCAPRATPLARLHPAVRLGGALLAAVTVFMLPGAAAGAAGLLAVALLHASGLRWIRQLAGLRAWWPAAISANSTATLLPSAAMNVCPRSTIATATSCDDWWARPMSYKPGKYAVSPL